MSDQEMPDAWSPFVSFLKGGGILACLGLLAWAMILDSVVPQLEDRGITLRKLQDGTIWRVELVGDQYGDEDLRLVTRLKSVESLILRGSRVTDAGVELLTGLPRLRILDLSETKITDAALASLSHCETLTQLSVAGCTGLTIRGMQELLRDCGQLQSYFLDFVPASYEELLRLEQEFPEVHFGVSAMSLFDIDPDGPVDVRWYPEGERTLSVGLRSRRWNDPELVAEIPPNTLLSLGIDVVELSQSVLDLLSHGNQLQRLNYRGPFTQELIQIIGQNLSLRELSLRHPRRGDASLSDISFQSLENLTSLTTLTMDGVRIPHEAFTALKSLKQLTHVNFVGCGLGDSELKILAELPNLESADLYGNELTDAAAPILFGMTQLKQCDFRGNQMSEAVMEQLNREKFQ